MVSPTASITWNFAYIFNAHAACKKCNGQEEAYDEHGDRHEYPGYGFETAVAKRLKYACTDSTYDKPPDHGMKIADEQMIQHTGYSYQKYGTGRLT